MSTRVSYHFLSYSKLLASYVTVLAKHQVGPNPTQVNVSLCVSDACSFISP